MICSCSQPGRSHRPKSRDLPIIAATVMRTAGILVTFFGGVVAPVFAHDPGHPELNTWFDNLRSSKGLCCSFADGFAVSDVDWESKGGHYRVRLENNGIDVPDDALIAEPNRTGRTMVWPLWVDGKVFIRCFIPGSMG